MTSRKWGSCFPALAKLGRGTRYPWWMKGLKIKCRSRFDSDCFAILAQDDNPKIDAHDDIAEMGFVLSRPSQARTGHPLVVVSVVREEQPQILRSAQDDTANSRVRAIPPKPSLDGAPIF